MPTPEEKARLEIDRQLAACGWLVQDFNAMNISAAVGVAVREYPLKTGFADYLLYANGKAIGIVEAKPEGQPLSEVEWQSRKYAQGLLPEARATAVLVGDDPGSHSYVAGKHRDCHEVGIESVFGGFYGKASSGVPRIPVLQLLDLDVGRSLLHHHNHDVLLPNPSVLPVRSPARRSRRGWRRTAAAWRSVPGSSDPRRCPP